MKTPRRPASVPVKIPFDHTVIPETWTDGWGDGSYTVYDQDADGCREGDGFVVAPDGSRAGLDWVVGKAVGRLRQIAPPDKSGWGFYEAVFPRPIFNTADLVEAFRAVLPKVEARYYRVVMPSSPVADYRRYPRGQYEMRVVPAAHLRRHLDCVPPAPDHFPTV